MDKHGARVIRPGAITGVQVLKTPAYIQWTGFIDQTALHLTKDDTGGELGACDIRTGQAGQNELGPNALSLSLSLCLYSAQTRTAPILWEIRLED